MTVSSTGLGFKVITPPSQVISAEDLRLHLRITGTDEDALIAAYLEAARAFAELYTGRSIGSQTLEIPLDSFPTSAIELVHGPVTEIVSIKYADPTTLVMTEFSDESYYLDNYGLQAWALPGLDITWPAVASIANAVLVRYVAGDFPDGVKAALLLMVGNLYENREAIGASSVQELPFGVRALLDPYRIRLGMA